MQTETIAAISTAPGRGAIGVLRLSGPNAARVAEKIIGTLPAPRVAGLRHFRNPAGEALDHGLVLYFPAPNSYTGETLVELQGHGGPVVLAELLGLACQHGARPARPGEFSERAFVNGRLDLAQAEAVADLIDAASSSAARAAVRALSGEFSQRVGVLVETLIGLRADLEAALDFADEEVPWINDVRLVQRLETLREQLAELQRAAARGRRLREGMVVAIVGRPNAGKSTLLNALAGDEVAIVSPIAGTTRDVLRESILIDGLPLTLIDTAGLRHTEDPIEREGVARARAVLAKAELALFLIDDTQGLSAEDVDLLADLPSGLPCLRIFTKADLSQRAVGPVAADEPGLANLTEADHNYLNPLNSLRISAATGAGIEALRQQLRTLAGLDSHAGEGQFTARARHLDALAQAAQAIDTALNLARKQAAGGFPHPELIAEDLRRAQQALDEITGRFTSDDLLGRIFSTFCIGK